MEKFVIIPDSSADMPLAMRERFGVPAVVRGTVYKPDGEQMLADVDWDSIAPEDYYLSMKGRNILYKTATPPVGEIMEVFEPFLKEGIDILSISLSSALSGTFQCCKTVAEDLMKKYPERKIICIDSLRYASAETLLISKGYEMQCKGASIEETAEYLDNLKHCIHQMGPLDDLFFCVKTGRISNLKALFGTLVGVNSLGDFSAVGLPAVVGKAKGKKTSIDATVGYVKRLIVNPEEQVLFVSHSNRAENAEYLVQRLREEIKPKDIVVNHISMSCGASTGPGLCAVYFIGNPVSDDHNTEQKALSEALEEVKKTR